MADHAPWVAQYGLVAPYGKCQCGCGKDTPLSRANDMRIGIQVGKPTRYCHGHNATASAADRLRRKTVVSESSSCWEWQAARTRSGYGIFSVRGKLTYVHRFSYELHIGPIPVGYHVCHRCDNPSCCNPDHLFLGTDRENLSDMRDKGRGSDPPKFQGDTHPNAKLSPDDVRTIRARVELGDNTNDIAVDFGISRSNVYAVARRETWQHIE